MRKKRKFGYFFVDLFFICNFGKPKLLSFGNKNKSFWTFILYFSHLFVTLAP